MLPQPGIEVQWTPCTGASPRQVPFGFAPFDYAQGRQDKPRGSAGHWPLVTGRWLALSVVEGSLVAGR